VNWTGYGRKWYWHNLGYCPGISVEWLVKPMNTSDRIACVQDGIRIRKLRYAKQRRHRFSYLVQFEVLYYKQDTGENPVIFTGDAKLTKRRQIIVQTSNFLQHHKLKM
jgi:hypothetical protein